ncbi:hypothetical protein ACFWY9_05300 [Amycolatopsis sp. NPDC059027]|uniref:hypothetical protein n=1 Tax=Amycolatopsis sp. NPDC059027 TaxID=3346709 RepID=UPI0036709033
MNGLWLHEVRRGGRLVLALPLAAAVVLGGLVPSLGAGIVTRTLVADALPVVAGLAAASVLTGERLVELHLTLPAPYPATVARRLAWLAVSALAGAVVLVAVPAAAGVLSGAAGALAGVVAFTAALLGVAAYAAARVRSAAGASAVVFAAWLAKVLVFDQAIRSVPVQVVLLLAAGVVLLRLAARRLGDIEALLRATEEA